MNCRHETVKMVGQRQDLGPVVYLNNTSQDAWHEGARKEGHVRSRSRPFMKCPG